MICPNCKKEFPDSLCVCPECGSTLAEITEEGGEDLGELVQAVVNVSEIEADQVISLLRGFGIPAFKTLASTLHLSILFGSAAFGVSVEVPEKKLEDAMSILNAGVDLEDWEEKTGEEKDE